MPAELNAALNFIRERVEREHGVSEPGPNDAAGHSPDDAGGFVLRENLSARFAQSFATVQAIAAHTSHDHAEGMRAIDLGDGAEKRIRRRATGIFLRSLMQFEMRATSIRRHDKMMISGASQT